MTLSRILGPNGAWTRRRFLKGVALSAGAFGWDWRDRTLLAGDSLDTLLEPIRRQYSLPGMTAAFARNEEAITLGVSGVRKNGSPERVEPEDLFHIGSNTKSMTATIVATLVEEGFLSWDTTLADAFPDLLDTMQPAYYPVTVRQLLSHRSGITDLAIFHDRAWTLEGPLPEQRRTMVEMVLSQRPTDPPATRYIYSNWGYVTAGAIAEQATGQAWEDLITERLFGPLEMDSAGFGAPGTPDRVDQPWGHRSPTCVPVPPGRFADNPPVYGPAGTVRCSLRDFAIYGLLHVRGALGEKGLLLTPESFQTLHRDWYSQGYALGWSLADRDWAGGRALTHAGSNTYWYHLTWLAPARNAVFVAAANCAENAFAACDSAVGAMIQRYLS